MTKFNVYFTATASYVVQVEAADRDEAIERAEEIAEFPRPTAYDKYDLGEWDLLEDPRDPYGAVEEASE